MIRPIVLDTDVASQSFKRRPAPVLTKVTGFDAVITFVTRGELVRWAELHAWGPNNWERLSRWLSDMPTLPGSDDVSDTWGRLSAAATRRGRPRPQNDTWIAATCLTYRLPLATLNVKDYADFAEHEGLELIAA